MQRQSSIYFLYIVNNYPTWDIYQWSCEQNSYENHH